jgi:UDP-N-acetylglucosamine 2-epimerase (non-hydrolysing)
MIHIFIGTKAQFIKTIPIIRELDARKIAYNLIDSGQHAEISRGLIAQFGLNPPDVRLRDSTQDIVSLGQALVWALKWGFRATFSPRWIKCNLFKGQNGICLIHGDTLSTLLSLYLAKRAGQKVAHIEAGLRSYSIFHPFPEELIRLITMHKADILFAPSNWAYENLHKMKVRGKIINVGENTIADTIKFALTRKPKDMHHESAYVLVTIHRLETLYSRARLRQLVELLIKIAADHQVLFVLHKPTQKQLEKFSLFDKLQTNPKIRLLPMQNYFDFLQLLKGCEFLITDGGSIQEESYYLNIPCLVMRKKTERTEGLGENVCLAEFDERKIDYFRQNYTQFKRKTEPESGVSPSQLIVDELCGA